MRTLLASFAFATIAAACSAPIRGVDAGGSDASGDAASELDGGLDAGPADAALDGGPDADLFVVTGIETHCLDDGTEAVTVAFDSLPLDPRTFDAATGLSGPILPTESGAS